MKIYIYLYQIFIVKYITKPSSYNQRKLKILKYASEHLGKSITPMELELNLEIPHDVAKVLLHYYRKQKIFRYRRRAHYYISQRGLARLEYLEKRIDIEEVTGIAIGLNHHAPLPKPSHEILRKYQELGGTVYSGFTL